MSIKLNSVGGGSVTIQEPNTASDFTLSVPAATANILTNKTAGTVLQVVSATKTDTQSTTTTIQSGGVQITGLTATITPSSASSKILVMAHLSGSGTSGVAQIYFKLYRNSTSIGSAPDEGSRVGSVNRIYYADANVTTSTNFNYLDSPATTSSITYSIYFGPDASTGYINRTQNDSNSVIGGRTTSSITVMEIAG
jgi:hypothetical protein